jgi:prepilin-type N-terminal cleavage/methylation domain-containing protein
MSSAAEQGWAMARRQPGFSLIEMVVAAAIFFVAMAGASTAIIGAIDVAKRAAVRDAMEAAVNLDLNWIRSYAKAWNCQTGPYANCKDVTIATPSTLSTSALNYQPDNITYPTAYAAFKTLCANRYSTSIATPAHQLLTDAHGIATGSTNPPPPPIPIPALADSEQAIPLSTSGLNAPEIARGYRLYRRISVPNNNGNYLSIFYYTKPADSPSLEFKRWASVFVEATSWCP